MVPESNARFRNSQIVPLRPWSHLRPIDILSGLGGLLDVMLSADDDTVWPINARFPAHPGVVLHEVQGLDHWQIIEDDGILDYILEEVRKCLDA